MKLETVPPEIRATLNKVTKYTLTGFTCDKCKTMTTTYDESVPAVCSVCQTPNPKKVFQDIITVTQKVETVQL